jgi:hypothetical protein
MQILLGGSVVGDVAQLIGSIGVIGSLLLMAWQTRQLAHQTAVSNTVGKTAARYNALERLHDIHKLIIEYPELRPYFYGSKPCPVGDPLRARVLTLAEMMADAIDYGLGVARQFPPVLTDSWYLTALAAAKQPVMQEIVRANPDYWPDLKARLKNESWMIAMAAPAPQVSAGRVV